jgi:hypothetical protein
MWDKDEARFAGIVKPLFPDHAEIHREPGRQSELSFWITWKLNNDPDRPNKHSRPIRLIFSQEALEDYLCLSDQRQSAATKRIIQFVTRRLSQFNPEHDVPRYQSVPPEEWVIAPEAIID